MLAHVSITGPMTGAVSDCEYGVLCSISVQAFIPESSSIISHHVKVAKACNSDTGNLIPELSNNGLMTVSIIDNPDDPQMKTLEGKMVDTISSEVGTAHVCWCGGMLKGRDCSKPEDWYGEIASFTMTGNRDEYYISLIMKYSTYSERKN